jgi:nickel-dependent lactate racemase
MNFDLVSGSMRETIALPEGHIAGIIRPDTSLGITPLTDQMIASAIDNPIGSSCLEDRLEVSSKVAIVVDDATRPTPTRRIIPLVLQKLSKIGIPDKNIAITIATGLHRPTTSAERSLILGDDIIKRFDVADNEARNPDVYRFAGTIEENKEIYLNKRVLDADFVITIGVVKSHAFAGFTGGAKSIVPGVASQRTIHENHCFYNIEYPRGVLGSCEMSATRKEMESAAKLINPYIINVVLGGSGEILFAVSGDVVEAHRAAVNFYKRIAARTIPEEVDIAIVYGGHAGSISFYQALFGCNVVKTTEHPILKKNGIVILYAECREGTGSLLFEQMMPAFPNASAILEHLATSKVVDDQWAVQFLATFIRDIYVFVVSKGIKPEIADMLGIKLFQNAAEAVNKAIGLSKPDYRIALIENPDILIVNKE